MISTYRKQLPISITTILRDYPFTCDTNKDVIREAVRCEKDIFFCDIEPTEQLQLAATMALLSARLSNQTAMIVVRTSEQAKNIYNYINSDKEQLAAESSGKTLASIRIASTFTKFKGNCLPLAMNKLIITSYTTLFRNLLYRKNKDDSIKAKIQLPIVDAYIFVDPFDENKSLNRAYKSWIFFDIDPLLSLLPQRKKTHIRKHYISVGLIPVEAIEEGFDNVTISSRESARAIYQDLKDIVLQDSLLRFVVVCLYSGSPSKKELIKRILKTKHIRIIQAEKKKTAAEMKQLLSELVFNSEYYQKFALFESLQEEHLGPFAVVRKEQSSYSRYTLTKFGQQYLIASTYFGEMLSNPLKILTTIRKKTENDIINWTLVQEIFHNFTKGQLQFDDLQLLIGKLKPSKEEEETIAGILSISNNSYLLFQVTQMLNCFREQMTQGTRDNLRSLNKTLLGSYNAEESSSIGKRDRHTLEKALKELLVNTEYPITLNKICSMLIVNTYEATQAIQDLIRNGFHVKALTVKPPKGRSLTYYTCKNFPAHFKVVCGDCHWYEKKRCTFWQRTKHIAERKVSSEEIHRATGTLRSNTVGCERFREKDTVTRKYSIEGFIDFIPKSFKGHSTENDELYVYLCPTCYEEERETEIEDFGTGDKPSQGLISISCPVCNSTFKLIQKRKKARSR